MIHKDDLLRAAELLEKQAELFVRDRDAPPIIALASRLRAAAEECVVVPSKKHPWGDFLKARADAIDWLYIDHDDDQIAHTLSMDEQQVFLIRTRNRSLAAAPGGEDE